MPAPPPLQGRHRIEHCFHGFRSASPNSTRGHHPRPCGPGRRRPLRVTNGQGRVYISPMTIDRMLISTGTPWEKKVGYSRAVRVGDMVFVSGTVAADESGQIVAPGDAGAQARYILTKIEKALREAGATMADVVRTRMYVTDMALMDAVGAAHGEVFREIRPASTMVAVAGLVPGALVEIEVEARISS